MTIYNIGNLTFKTKTAAHKYTKNIIDELGYCIIDSTHDKFNFFSDLIKNHKNPESKIGCGIDFFISKKTN